jgi:hypothetical protein
MQDKLIKSQGIRDESVASNDDALGPNDSRVV